jgi:O-acetyl-ADP-ribose deacetylase (regulator of RNase III)
MADILNYINGDLLECDAKYIVHQTNCITTLAAGIAKSIFTKFPYSNIYENREITSEHDIPGTIKIKGNGTDQRYIIALFGQYYPGNPDSHETECMRKWWFFTGLKEISKIQNIETIAFPYGIGCGLAGGNWSEYENILNNFSIHINKTQGAKTYVYKIF